MQSPHDPSPRRTPSTPIPHHPTNALPRGYMPQAMPSTHPSLIWTTQTQSHNRFYQSSGSSSSHAESSPFYTPYHQFQSYDTPQQQPISQADHTHSYPMHPQPPSPYVYPSNYPVEYTFQPPYQPSENPDNNNHYHSQHNNSNIAPGSTPYFPPPPPH
ncbi:hypothetical protein BT96DRAFT_928844 [Gymnopus androsaceus JB14]|uniref:Uncharacterized protein n=1 Tax=Gymnopus androsaceus JB14 TaxID=1447944 RepID=A0A6A4GJ94_9AGAR|nr:hypothetical protein BT96DRAFT_928844 [Gymnopus androsaceus JB14]